MTTLGSRKGLCLHSGLHGFNPFGGGQWVVNLLKTRLTV